MAPPDRMERTVMSAGVRLYWGEAEAEKRNALVMAWEVTSVGRCWPP